MANYLTIDIGNSSAKAAVWTDDKLAARPIWGDLRPADLRQLCSAVCGPLACAAVCSVAHDPYGLVKAAGAMALDLIEVDASTPLPLSLGDYATATLGADRLAAMAGALGLYPGQELLVIDCGTAITYDLLSPEAVFQGGNIAPGLGMRLKALHAFTARLPEVETDPQAPLMGHNTVQAMQAGALRGVVGEIEYYQRQWPGATTVLTGGRALDLAPYLTLPITIDTDLVLRGLMKIIVYNENK
ncbi:MAG: type III pantothenate kinase [Bacteroidales bacterium]|nr:type III pantothenate kinase [Bacteroidales bacterium]